MEKVILFGLLGFASLLAHSQESIVGLRLGIVDMGIIGSIGANQEILYEYRPKGRLSYSIHLGRGTQSNFPQSFNPGKLDTGIPPIAIDFLRYLQAIKAMPGEWQKNNFKYAHLLLNYGLSPRKSKTSIHIVTGLSIGNYQSFQLHVDNYTYDTSVDGVVSFKANYDLERTLAPAWILGLSLRRKISKDYQLSLDSRFNFIIGDFYSIYHFGLLQIGVNRKIFK